MIDWIFTKTPLTFLVQNLWRDEAFTYMMAQQSIGEIIRSTALDFNPPLYYVLMHYWMMIFGTSEIALRTVSLFFFVLTVFTMLEILVHVYKIPLKRALIYFALFLGNPVMVTYAFEARMYMMAIFFVTLSYFAYVTGRKKMYVMATALALYTHYFTLLVLGSQLVLALIHKLVNHSKHDYSLKQLLAPYLAFLPWVVYLLSQIGSRTSDFWVTKPLISDVFFLPFVVFSGYQRVFGEYYHSGPGYELSHLVMNIGIVAIICIPWLMMSVDMRHKKVRTNLFRIHHVTTFFMKYFSQISVCAWAFVPPLALFALSFFSTPLYHPRYFSFSVVGLLLCMVLGIESAITSKSLQKYRWNLFFSGIILWVAVTYQYNVNLLKYNQKRLISPMYREIDTSLREMDKVYLMNELDFFLAKYYMRHGDIYIFGQSYEDLKPYIGTVLIPATQVISSFPQYPSRAFVVSYDNYIVRSTL